MKIVDSEPFSLTTYCFQFYKWIGNIKNVLGKERANGDLRCSAKFGRAGGSLEELGISKRSSGELGIAQQSSVKVGGARQSSAENGGGRWCSTELYPF